MRAEEDQATLDYSSWKRLLRPPFRNDEWSSEDVWVGALDILNGTDRNLKQRLAKDITDDGYAGLQYVKQVMTADFASGFSFGIEFATHVVPFLLTISHRSLLESMAVDTYVGDLYQFVCGSNGERAIPFFNRVGERLFSEAQSPYFVARSECVPFAKALVATSIALRETVRRSQRAAFGNNLPDIINRLRDTIQPSGLTDQSPDYHVVRTCLDELSGLVRRARGLLVESDDLSSGTENLTITRAASNFRDLDLPGNRHDNDFLDIAKIAILPTFAEIKSDRPEFLPYKDKNMPHFLHGTDRLVDTHFRLLRHDVFGAMKDTIGGLLNSLGAQPDSGGAVKLYVGNNQRCHIYEQAHIARLSYERRRGLEIQISFLQPWQIRKEPKSARMKWWKERKRLEEGSLLCLISSTEGKESALLLVVSKKDTDQNQKFGLASEGSHAQITVRLARDGIGNDLEYLAEWYHRRQSLQQILIEFPDTIPATFLPILKNLQEMHRLGHIPFRRWIVPDAEGSIDPTTAHGADPQGIPPPAYTLRPHFVFDLRKICKTVHSQYTVSPRTPTNDQTTLAGLKQNTSLDDGQCRALLTALTQEFALIQGPPGTGKSYVGVQLMRVLVDNKEKGDLGPVVVVCYTNHALDQFLESLVEAGIERVVRVGGQSKSNTLEGMNLRQLTRPEDRSKNERWLLHQLFEGMEKEESDIVRKLAILAGLRKRTWAGMKRHLKQHYQAIFCQFSRIGSDGFTKVSKGEPFEAWMTGKIEMAEEDPGSPPREINMILEDANIDVYDLPQSERDILVEHWAQEAIDENLDALAYHLEENEERSRGQGKIHDEVDRRRLQDANVIGITTTGLARKIQTLSRIQTKVVICEEAAEVLESHILSTLLPSVEHVIQIGDHQQLRPQISNFNLSLESQTGSVYRLDESMFERLSKGSGGARPFPVAQLNVQRRMRPDISKLIRGTIYPSLADHKSVTEYPDVVGMRKNVFWLDHSNFEAGSDDKDPQQKSHSNYWEVAMVHALVRHLVRQGVYESGDIAVLTPYTGQLQSLRKELNQSFEIIISDRDREALAREGIDEVSKEAFVEGGGLVVRKKSLSEMLRVATVDNFQGEEAKIIIISLVRSNRNRKVGFLKTTNRINVLLSRAKHGMYILGNADTASSVKMWIDVIEMLRASDSIGDSLGLCCSRHKSTEIRVNEPEDFLQVAPEGGCKLQCDK